MSDAASILLRTQYLFEGHHKLRHIPRNSQWKSQTAVPRTWVRNDIVLSLFKLLMKRGYFVIHLCCRFPWLHGLTPNSKAVNSLLFRVRIPPGSWIPVCCKCCVLSVRGLCDGPITHPEEPYRMCLCVCVCVCVRHWVWSAATIILCIYIGKVEEVRLRNTERKKKYFLFTKPLPIIMQLILFLSPLTASTTILWATGQNYRT
jgi:hypothetical protein